GLVLFATSADALILGRNLGSVSGGGSIITTAALDVYGACLPAPSSLTAPYGSSKTWYVSGTDVSPAGDTPDNGADGTAAHPYNSLTALFAGNGNSKYTGYSGGVRAAFGTLTLTPTVTSTLSNTVIWKRDRDGALYAGQQHTASFTTPVTVKIAAIEPGAWTTISPTDTFTLVSGSLTSGVTVTSVASTTPGQNPEDWDPSHSYIWPGDVIVVNGHNPNWETNSPPSGVPHEFSLTALVGLHSVDDTGATKWTIIQGGPSAPHLDEIVGGGVQGIIINGDPANKLSIGNPNTLNATAHQGGAIQMGAGFQTTLPTTSPQTALIFGPITWNYVNAHTGDHQIVINGSYIDALYNTWNELSRDTTTTSLVTIGSIGSGGGSPGTSFGFNWKVGSTTTTVSLAPDLLWDSTNHVTTLTDGSAFVADGITWTLVTGTPGTHQILIDKSLDGTLDNISAALIANDPSLTFTKLTGVFFNVASIAVGPAGALPLRFVNVTTNATITKVGSTMPILFASNLALNQRNVSLSSIQDVILA